MAEESNVQDEEMPSLDNLAVPRDAVENRTVSRNSLISLIFLSTKALDVDDSLTNSFVVDKI